MNCRNLIKEVIQKFKDGKEGSETYGWDEGIAP